MTNITHIQFHIGDFLSGVMHMDGTEIGAYTMLIMAHYQAGEKGLPDDDERLKRITKTNTKVWNRIKPTVLEKFTLKDGMWTHKRVLDELAKIKAKAGPGRPEQEDKSPAGNPKPDLQKPTCDAQLKNKSLKNNNSQKTNQEPITNAAVVARAREGPDDISEHVELGKRIEEIVGWDNDPNYFPDYSRIKTWLEHGWSAERDILPTVQKLAQAKKAKKRGKPKTLRYFEEAIADAHAANKQPLPEGEVNYGSRSKSGSAADSLIAGFSQADY